MMLKLTLKQTLECKMISNLILLVTPFKMKLTLKIPTMLTSTHSLMLLSRTLTTLLLSMKRIKMLLMIQIHRPRLTMSSLVMLLPKLKLTLQ